MRYADRVVGGLTVELLLSVGGFGTHDRCLVMNATVRSIDVVAAASS